MPKPGEREKKKDKKYAGFILQSTLKLHPVTLKLKLPAASGGESSR
jgi:hypothetical protein